MIILAVDTSGPVCGVAVMDGEKIICEQMVRNKLTHSANLLPMIDFALTSASLTLQQIDRIAVVTGPGSFTGVRIGVSTIKGIAHGSGIPCVAVDALEAMSVSAGLLESGEPENLTNDKGCWYSGIICPVQDARAGQVYGAAFQNGARLMNDTPMKIEDYVNMVYQYGDNCLFTGDGVDVHRNAIIELSSGRAKFASPQSVYLRPASVALLGSRVTSADEKDEFTLMPMYLRPPNAQKNKKLLEAQKENGKSV